MFELSRSSGADLQNTDQRADGMPSRISAACAKGCRKFKVIANSAKANAVARQPDPGFLRLMGRNIAPRSAIVNRYASDRRACSENFGLALRSPHRCYVSQRL